MSQQEKELHPVYLQYTKEEVTQAAKVAHSVSQAVCEAFNLPKLGQWEFCSDWYKASIINSVEQILFRARSCRYLHNQWRNIKLHQGWTLGPKDPEKMQHPHLVDYNDLPIEIKLKLKLFRAAVMPFRKNDGPGFHKK